MPIYITSHLLTNPAHSYAKPRRFFRCPDQTWKEWHADVCLCLSIFFVSFILVVSYCISCLDTLYLLQLASRRNHWLLLVSWARFSVCRFSTWFTRTIQRSPIRGHLNPFNAFPPYLRSILMPSICVFFPQVICFLQSHHRMTHTPLVSRYLTWSS